MWTERALDGLAAIRAYIGAVKPLPAQRMAGRLVAAADGLSEFPGRFRSAGPVRELVAIKPYVIRYRVKGECIVILRIRHGARRPIR